MTTWLRAAMAAAILLTLTACGDPTKADIIEKARGVETREQLQKKLGKPTEISKLGPIEQWTYKAKDGQVTFILTGDSVAMQAAE
ncbi:MAG: hypothetical protein AB7M05_09560 [Alphaproteobacteria bacterium]